MSVYSTYSSQYVITLFNSLLPFILCSSIFLVIRENTVIFMKASKFQEDKIYDHISSPKYSLISLSKFNLPLIGSFYVTHAARALQSHDLSGEGIKPWITDILFLPHKDMEGLPG